jgi:hypothetical protein
MRTASVGRTVVALVLAGALNTRARAEPPGGEGGGKAPAARPGDIFVAPAKPFSLLAPLPGERTPPRENEYELRRADDGSGDLVYGASSFEGRIHRDGSVTFRDKSVTISLLPAWFPLRTGVRGPTVQGLFRNILIGQTTNPTGTPHPARSAADDAPADLRAVIPGVTPYRPDPREACRYPQACFFTADLFALSATGTFDLTDALMRMNGKDPYRVEKARFLTQTSELRVRLAARAHGDDVRNATVSLHAELESIATNQRLTQAEKRAIINGLAAELDAATDEGRQARVQIEAFVRQRLPLPDAGS